MRLILREARVPRATLDSAEALLAANAHLPGAAKLILGARGCPRLRAEAPQGWEAWAELSLERAQRHLLGEPLPPLEAPPPQLSLASRLEECGWTCTERQPGVWVTQSGHPSAPIELHDGAALRLQLPLISWQEVAPLCLEALQRFLMQAASALRLVRPALRPEGAFLLLELPHDAPTELLTLAMDALHVGGSWMAREAQALLHNEPLARTYLNHNPWKG